MVKAPGKLQPTGSADRRMRVVEGNNSPIELIRLAFVARFVQRRCKVKQGVGMIGPITVRLPIGDQRLTWPAKLAQTMAELEPDACAFRTAADNLSVGIRRLCPTRLIAQCIRHPDSGSIEQFEEVSHRQPICCSHP